MSDLEMGRPEMNPSQVGVAGETWTAVGSAADIAKRKKVVVEVGERQILLLADGDSVYAFDNICVHRERELSKGVILNGKIVCPGHQWAFALPTGWEAIKQVCQPSYETRVTDDVVEVRTDCPKPPPAP